MSAPAVTPGPWSLREVSDPTQHVFLIESSTGPVALVPADGPEATAAAHLLKAVPTMYEALRAVDLEGRDVGDGDVVIPFEVWDQVCVALAEAVQP